MAKEPSVIDSLLDGISVQQMQQVKGSLTVDYDDIQQFVNKSKDFYPEDILLTEVVLRAFGCIQPVNVKKLSAITKVTTNKIKSYEKKLLAEIEERKNLNREHLIKVLDVLDYSRLFNPKAPIETSKFVRKNVLGQELEKEQGDIIKINNVEIIMNSDMRKQIINETASQKELFFHKEKALPKQIKPEDDFLTTYVEDMKELVNKTVNGVTNESKEEKTTQPVP